MRAVVNRISLATPIDDQVFEAARRELPALAAGIPGVDSLALIRCGAEELFVLIVADTAEDLDRLRDEVGNVWMRANVVPHAAGPPQRSVGEVVFDCRRG